MHALARALCAFAIFATPAFADTLTLRPRVEATGPAITLGDVFTGAGAEAARTIAPSPSAGQTATLPADFLVAAAQSAGHDWTPTVNEVRVTRPGGARATMAVSSPTYGQAAEPPAVQRNESIALTFAAPGLSLTTRARALQPGAVGQRIRVVNLQSNRTIDAVITGPGAATVN